MTTLRVLIIECAECWELLWSDNTYEYVNTAAEALEVVKKRGRAMSSNNICSVITIVWQPKTRIGRQVVKALQD